MHFAQRPFAVIAAPTCFSSVYGLSAFAFCSLLFSLVLEVFDLPQSLYSLFFCSGLGHHFTASTLHNVFATFSFANHSPSLKFKIHITIFTTFNRLIIPTEPCFHIENQKWPIDRARFTFWPKAFANNTLMHQIHHEDF